jgi:hypothetical protein
MEILLKGLLNENSGDGEKFKLDMLYYSNQSGKQKYGMKRVEIAFIYVKWILRLAQLFYECKT